MASERWDIAVHRAFDSVREFLNDLHIPFSTAALSEVEEAMTSSETLDEAQERTWNSLVQTIYTAQENDSNDVQAHASHLHYTFHELVGPLTPALPSMLRWYRDDSSVRRIALTATDIRGVSIAAMRPIKVTNATAHVDMRNVIALGGGVASGTIHQRDFAWTVFNNTTPDNNNIDLSDDFSPALLFIPPEYRYDQAFNANSSVDTALFLRSALEELGLYGTRAVVSQDIRLFNTPQASGPSEASFFGFGARNLPSDEWVDLLDTPPTVGVAGKLSDELTPEVARTALRNLERIYYILKEMGVAMRAWNNTIVNKRTGEVFLGEGDNPVLLNADLLETAMANPRAFLNSIHSKDSWPHFPNLVVVGRLRGLIRGDAQLAMIVDMLAKKSGVELGTDIQGHVQRIVDNFRLLTEFLDDPALRESVADHLKLNTIRSIAANYLHVLGTNGMLNFFSFVMKEIVIRVKFDRWVETAAFLIDEASHSRESNKDQYWSKNAERILNMDEEGNIDNGGQNSPSNPPSEGVPNPDAGTNGSPRVGQAKESTVTGLFETNETSSGGEMMRFPGVSSATYMRLAAHQHTDVAGRAMPFQYNILFRGAMRVFAPPIRGTMPILN